MNYLLFMLISLFLSGCMGGSNAANNNDGSSADFVPTSKYYGKVPQKPYSEQTIAYTAANKSISACFLDKGTGSLINCQNAADADFGSTNNIVSSGSNLFVQDNKNGAIWGCTLAGDLSLNCQVVHSGISNMNSITVANGYLYISMGVYPSGFEGKPSSQIMQCLINGSALQNCIYYSQKLMWAGYLTSYQNYLYVSGADSLSGYVGEAYFAELENGHIINTPQSANSSQSALLMAVTSSGYMFALDGANNINVCQVSSTDGTMDNCNLQYSLSDIAGTNTIGTQTSFNSFNLYNNYLYIGASNNMTKSGAPLKQGFYVCQYNAQGDVVNGCVPTGAGLSDASGVVFLQETVDNNDKVIGPVAFIATGNTIMAGRQQPSNQGKIGPTASVFQNINPLPGNPTSIQVLKDIAFIITNNAITYCLINVEQFEDCQSYNPPGVTNMTSSSLTGNTLYVQSSNGISAFNVSISGSFENQMVHISLEDTPPISNVTALAGVDFKTSGAVYWLDNSNVLNYCSGELGSNYAACPNNIQTASKSSSETASSFISYNNYFYFAVKNSIERCGLSGFDVTETCASSMPLPSGVVVNNLSISNNYLYVTTNEGSGIAPVYAYPIHSTMSLGTPVPVVPSGNSFNGATAITFADSIPVNGGLENGKNYNVVFASNSTGILSGNYMGNGSIDNLRSAISGVNPFIHTKGLVTYRAANGKYYLYITDSEANMVTKCTILGFTAKDCVAPTTMQIMGATNIVIAAKSRLAYVSGSNNFLYQFKIDDEGNFYDAAVASTMSQNNISSLSIFEDESGNGILFISTAISPMPPGSPVWHKWETFLVMAAIKLTIKVDTFGLGVGIRALGEGASIGVDTNTAPEIGSQQGDNPSVTNNWQTYIDNQLSEAGDNNPTVKSVEEICSDMDATSDSDVNGYSGYIPKCIARLAQTNPNLQPINQVMNVDAPAIEPDNQMAQRDIDEVAAENPAIDNQLNNCAIAANPQSCAGEIVINENNDLTVTEALNIEYDNITKLCEETWKSIYPTFEACVTGEKKELFAQALQANDLKLSTRINEIQQNYPFTYYQYQAYAQKSIGLSSILVPITMKYPASPLGITQDINSKQQSLAILGVIPTAFTITSGYQDNEESAESSLFATAYDTLNNLQNSPTLGCHFRANLPVIATDESSIINGVTDCEVWSLSPLIQPTGLTIDKTNNGLSLMVTSPRMQSIGGSITQNNISYCELPESAELAFNESGQPYVKTKISISAYCLNGTGQVAPGVSLSSVIQNPTATVPTSDGKGVFVSGGNAIAYCNYTSPGSGELQQCQPSATNLQGGTINGITIYHPGL